MKVSWPPTACRDLAPRFFQRALVPPHVTEVHVQDKMHAIQSTRILWSTPRTGVEETHETPCTLKCGHVLHSQANEKQGSKGLRGLHQILHTYTRLQARAHSWRKQRRSLIAHCHCRNRRGGSSFPGANPEYRHASDRRTSFSNSTQSEPEV